MGQGEGEEKPAEGEEGAKEKVEDVENAGES